MPGLLTAEFPILTTWCVIGGNSLIIVVRKPLLDTRALLGVCGCTSCPCLSVHLVRLFLPFPCRFPFGPPVLSEPGRGRRRRCCCRLLLLFALVSLRCSVKLDSSARVRVWLAWVLWRRSLARRVNLYLLSFAC